MTRPRIYSTSRDMVIAIVLIFVAMMVSIGASVLYTNRVDHESSHALCEILDSLAKRNAEVVNPDQPTLEFRAQLDRLRTIYHCK